MYFLDGRTVTGRAIVSDCSEDNVSNTSRLWHMRLGHVGKTAFQGLVKQGILKGAKIGKLGLCEHCILPKQTRVKFGTAVHCTQGTLDYVHTNVWGPTKVWVITFVDDFLRRVWVHTMQHKDEVLNVFLKWKKMIET